MQRFTSVLIIFEELKVLTPVKYIELFLVRAVGKDSLAETCAAAYHLDIFDARVYRLKEYQVKNVWYINTGIQHIHRHYNLRHFIPQFEVVNDILGIFHRVVNTLAEIRVELWIEFMEAIYNQLSVEFIICKDNGFAKLVAVIDL